MNLHDRDIKKAAKEEGRIEGAQQQAIETARRMLIKKFSPDDISEMTGLSLEEIQELQKNTPVKSKN